MFRHCAYCGHCRWEYSRSGQTAHLRTKHNIRNIDRLPLEEYLAEHFISHDFGEYGESLHSGGAQVRPTDTKAAPVLAELA